MKYRKRSNKKISRNKKPFKNKEQPTAWIYFEYGKIGHIKLGCPILKQKHKLEGKSESSKYKEKKKTYVVCEDDDLAHPVTPVKVLKRKQIVVGWLMQNLPRVV